MALQVRKLTRSNVTCTALCMGFCEEFKARRYISRIWLRPGCYPPRFEGEDEELTLQRKVPEGTSEYCHGKVITASYLLEQIALTLLGAIGIFGDMLSDAYMAYSLYHDVLYSNLSRTFLGVPLKDLYTYLTIISLLMWLVSSILTVRALPAPQPGASTHFSSPSHPSSPTCPSLQAAYDFLRGMKQHRSESAPRSLLHLLAKWFVLAFNVQLWMLELANPRQVVKIFCVRDKGPDGKPREHCASAT